MSSLGCSLIEYVVFPCNLFSYISNFIVHDFQSCSTNTPVQLILNVHVYYTEDYSDTFGSYSFSQYDSKGIKWKPELAHDYSNLLLSQLREINCIILKITHEESILGMGIDKLSDLMYNCAFTIFG